jgi:hypothetical protein
MFPPASTELFFAQFYKRYGKGSLLKCKGDGEVAETTADFAEGLEKIAETERGFLQVKCAGPECPYQLSKECGRMASLQVILPELSGIGVWQINTGSFNSIVNINSAIEWLTGLCGRYAMIPINLMRQEQDIAYEGKRSKHYILAIDQNISIGEIQRFAMITPIERALIPGPGEEKDELFYDANGKKPELLDLSGQNEPVDGPTMGDPEKTSTIGGSASIVDTAQANATKRATLEAASKKKGPLMANFDDEMKARKPFNDLQAGIKTCKTRLHVKEYCEKIRDQINALPAEHKEELRNWTSAYMKGLKI